MLQSIASPSCIDISRQLLSDIRKELKKPDEGAAMEASDETNLTLIVMKYYAGPSIVSCIFKSPFSEALARTFLGQLLDALSHAFRLGISHRDVKVRTPPWLILSGLLCTTPTSLFIPSALLCSVLHTRLRTCFSMWTASCGWATGGSAWLAWTHGQSA
jgi:serine/threonine protein kinase